MTDPWVKAMVEDPDQGGIGVEMRRGGDHAWVTFYGRQGGRHVTRALDERRCRELGRLLSQAAKAIERNRRAEP